MLCSGSDGQLVAYQKMVQSLSRCGELVKDSNNYKAKVRKLLNCFFLQPDARDQQQSKYFCKHATLRGILADEVVRKGEKALVLLSGNDKEVKLASLEDWLSFFKCEVGKKKMKGFEVLVLRLETDVTGLNLQEANNIIFMAPYIEFSKVDQAIGRILRMGQMRKEVNIWFLCGNNWAEKLALETLLSSLCNSDTLVNPAPQGDDQDDMEGQEDASQSSETPRKSNLLVEAPEYEQLLRSVMAKQQHPDDIPFKSAHSNASWQAFVDKTQWDRERYWIVDDFEYQGCRGKFVGRLTPDLQLHCGRINNAYFHADQQGNEVPDPRIFDEINEAVKRAQAVNHVITFSRLEEERYRPLSEEERRKREDEDKPEKRQRRQELLLRRRTALFTDKINEIKTQPMLDVCAFPQHGEDAANYLREHVRHWEKRLKTKSTKIYIGACADYDDRFKQVSPTGDEYKCMVVFLRVQASDKNDEETYKMAFETTRFLESHLIKQASMVGDPLNISEGGDGLTEGSSKYYIYFRLPHEPARIYEVGNDDDDDDEDTQLKGASEEGLGDDGNEDKKGAQKEEIAS